MNVIGFCALAVLAIASTFLAFWKVEYKPLFFVSAILWLGMGGFALELSGGSTMWRVPAILGLGMTLVMMFFVFFYFREKHEYVDPLKQHQDHYAATLARIRARRQKIGGLRKRRRQIEYPDYRG